MYCCVECGSTTEKIFLKRATYFQINKCKSCKNLVDTYFELSRTIRLIELLLVKKKVLRHFIFNMPMHNGSLVLWTALSVWIRLMLVIRGSSAAPLCENTANPFLGRLVTYLPVTIAEHLAYVAVIWHLHAGSRVSVLSIAKTIAFANYFQAFNFLSILWNYRNHAMYEAVADALTLFAHVKAVALLCKWPYFETCAKIAVAKLVSSNTDMLLATPLWGSVSSNSQAIV